MYDIGIIGGGIAGMSAAIYGSRAGKKVLIIEGTGFGGQMNLTSHIENYPGIRNVSGNELAKELKAQVESLGADIKVAVVKKIVLNSEKKNIADNQKCSNGMIVTDTEELTYKTIVADTEELHCKTIIIATGQTHRKLGIPGEDKFIGMGVSYCAVCDGAFFKGMNVAVVGGGSTAIENAAYLSNHCNKVYLIHRRDAFRGEDYLVQSLKEKANVELVLNHRVTEIKGGFTVERVNLENTLTGEKEELSVDGVFVAVGQIPQNERFADIVEIDENGYIVAGEDCRTSEAGIFAVGDCRTKNVRQLVTAAADGAVAALGACSEME